MTNIQKTKTRQKNKPEWSMVNLTLTGTYLDPEIITKILNIVPECRAKRGDIFTKSKKWKHGYWLIDGGPTNWKVETQLKKIIKEITPVKNKLKKLIKNDKTIQYAYLTICLEPPDGIANANYYFDSGLINEFTSLGIDIALSIDIKSEWYKALVMVNKKEKLKSKKKK